MSVIKRALLYITRKKVKTFIIFAVLLCMSTAVLSGVAVKRAADNMQSDLDKKTMSGIILGNNMENNMGTARGAGNVKPEDVKKISQLPGVLHTVKRICSSGVLVDKKGVPVKNRREADPYINMVAVVGYNSTSNDVKFSSGKLKLEQGRHIKEGDVHKALIHETFAKQNNVKIGDYITVRGNEKDYDNVKKVKKKIKLQVVGIFSGKSSDHAVYSGDLAENLIISDISTARELYGYTEKSEIYMDATFLTKGSKNVEELMDKIQELDIDWRMYQMSRSGDMLLGMSGAISGIYKLVKVVMIAAMVISAAVLILILLLWLGERKKETAIFMSLGYSKLKIVLQYIVELIVILTMSTCIAFFIAKSVAQPLGDKLLSKSVSNFASEMNNGQGNMGADLDTSIATQTPQKIDVEMKTGDILRVIAIGSGVVLISVLISSVPMIRRKPKDLLSHFE